MWKLEPPLFISKIRDQETRSVDIWEEKFWSPPVKTLTDSELLGSKPISCKPHWSSFLELMLTPLPSSTQTLIQLINNLFSVNVMENKLHSRMPVWFVFLNNLMVKNRKKLERGGKI